MARGAEHYYVRLDDDPTSVLVMAGPVELTSFSMYNNDTATGYLLLFDQTAAIDVDGDPAPDYVIGCASATAIHGEFCSPIMFTNGLVIAFSASATGASPTTGSSADVSLGIKRG